MTAVSLPSLARFSPLGQPFDKYVLPWDQPGKYKGKLTINNSGLGEIKRVITGEPGFFGGSTKAFDMGTEVHRATLTPWESRTLLFDEYTEFLVQGMITALSKHKGFQKHLKGAIVEELRVGMVFDTLMRGTLDLEKAKHGGDIKTTSSKSLHEFIKCMFKFGYWRQARVYMLLRKLDRFTFYPVQKFPPFEVYEVCVNDYASDLKDIDYELKFLLDIYNRYGFPTMD